MFEDPIDARDAPIRRSRIVLDHLDRGDIPPVAEDTHLDCKEDRAGPGAESRDPPSRARRPDRVVDRERGRGPRSSETVIGTR
jgi:hypothetical protein